jgi:hypothetical protein
VEGRLNEFLDWVNRPIYIASTIDLGATKQIKHIDNTKHRDASNNNVKKFHQGSSQVHEFKRKEKYQTCQFCRHGMHDLISCPKFTRSDMKKRWDMAHKFRTCFSCLKKHFGKYESRIICGVDNCTKNHHRLLHKDIRPPAVTLNIENAAPLIKVTLKMLPIRLRERSLTMAETLHYWVLPLL